MTERMHDRYGSTSHFYGVHGSFLLETGCFYCDVFFGNIGILTCWSHSSSMSRIRNWAWTLPWPTTLQITFQCWVGHPFGPCWHWRQTWAAHQEVWVNLVNRSICSHGTDLSCRRTRAHTIIFSLCKYRLQNTNTIKHMYADNWRVS